MIFSVKSVLKPLKKQENHKSPQKSLKNWKNAIDNRKTSCKGSEQWLKNDVSRETFWQNSKKRTKTVERKQ